MVDTHRNPPRRRSVPSQKRRDAHPRIRRDQVLRPRRRSILDIAMRDLINHGEMIGGLACLRLAMGLYITTTP